MTKRRVLSGMRATGGLHLGNYLGAIRQWVETQTSQECFYFIADLHGLTEATESHSPSLFLEQRLRTATGLIACGLDPTKVVLFFQSSVHQHTELMWYLSVVARKGELERMTQWKDKGGHDQASSSAGLFVYPILMASDILLYDATDVPVGDDQRQHVEVTRDWALRFNSYFGSTFVVPEAVVPPRAARIMDLQYPDSKMSKSSASTLGTLFVDDDPKELRAKIRKAVTDGDASIRRSRDKPGVTNLIEIYGALTNSSLDSVENAFAGKTYSQLKDAVADAAVAELLPIASRQRELLGDRAEVGRLLDIGADRARGVAEETCTRVRKALGTRDL